MVSMFFRTSPWVWNSLLSAQKDLAFSRFSLQHLNSLAVHAFEVNLLISISKFLINTEPHILAVIMK